MKTREFVIVENIGIVCLLYLTADLKKNAKLTVICELREESKTGSQGCLYTVTLTRIFAYISWCIFSNIKFLWVKSRQSKIARHSAGNQAWQQFAYANYFARIWSLELLKHCVKKNMPNIIILYLCWTREAHWTSLPEVSIHKIK